MKLPITGADYPKGNFFTSHPVWIPKKIKLTVSMILLLGDIGKVYFF